MTPQMPHTGVWKTFTLVGFAAAAAMLTIGIIVPPADIWIKGCLAMASLFLTGTTFTLAKTLRERPCATSARRAGRST